MGINNLVTHEGNQTMPYITSIERVGMLKAHRECLIPVLETRFGEVPPKFLEMINNLYTKKSQYHIVPQTPVSLIRKA